VKYCFVVVDVEVHSNLFHDVYKNSNEIEYFLMLMNPCCYSRKENLSIYLYVYSDRSNRWSLFRKLVTNQIRKKNFQENRLDFF
jgi:hypothetical protein